MAPTKSPLKVDVTSFFTLFDNTSYNNLPTWKENISMPWCVRTLKIVGPEEVEVSDLCNFEFCEGYFDRLLITDREHGEEIRIIIFPKFLFNQMFFGENPTHYTMHFIKYKYGKADDITPSDYKYIAEEYKKGQENDSK
jgi:hypothetical protein